MSIADKITSIETHLENDYEGLENLGVTAEDRNIENIRTCLDELYNNIPKTTDTGTNLSLNTIKGKMEIIPKGDTSQNGTPTPDTPIDIEVVTGTQEVKVENKNLVPFPYYDSDVDDRNGVKWTINNDGTINAVGTANASSSIFYLTNGDSDIYLNAGTYKISGNFSGSQFNLQIIQIVNGSYGTVYWNDMVLTERTRLRIRVIAKANTQVNATNCYLMIEKGSVATPYTPHQEQTQTISLGDIELCKIGNYQDYLYKSGDKWYKKEQIGKVVLNGSETDWSLQSINSYGIANFQRALSDYNTVEQNLAYCNEFSPQATLIASEKNEGFYINFNKNIFVRIKSTRASTTSELTTWLSSNNMTLYYVLATPNDIEITNTTLIEQLNNLEKMYSYNGITNISSNGNLPIVLGVSALKGES